MAQHLITNYDKFFSEAVTHLSAQQRLSHDTETTGLFPFHGDRSFSHVFADKDDEFYFNFNPLHGGIHEQHKKELQPVFDDEKRIVFYCNAIYDATISHFDDLVFHQRIVDIPSIARVEFNRHSPNQYATEESFLSLEYLARYYKVQHKLDIVKKYIKENNLYKRDEQGEFIICPIKNEKIKDFASVPLDLMFEYGCGDVRSTFDTGEKVIKYINYKDRTGGMPHKMINVAQNEIKLTSALVDMKISGMGLWEDYVKLAKATEYENYKLILDELRPMIGDININSPKQMSELLLSKGVKLPLKEPTANDLKLAKNNLEKIKVWEDEIENKFKGKQKNIDTRIKWISQARQKADDYMKGRYKTDKKTIEKIVEKNQHLDFLRLITEAKEADKKCNTYYGNYLKLQDENNIIHCQLNQEKAITGRFSSSDPNLQNVTKEKWDGSDNALLVRKSFIPKDLDFNLLFGDYRGQEMYIMIDLAGDMEVIKDILENGTDIYIAMANMVKKFTGIVISRADAKALSLGVAYGQGIDLIAKNLGCKRQQAKDLKEAFLKALSGVARLSKKMMNQAKSTGKIQNPYGRVSYIERGYEYKALNSLIQGTAADCTKHAMVELHKFLKPYKTHMVLTVHDEIVFELHKDEHHLVDDISRIMSEAYPHKHLPLRVDLEFSKRSWGEKKLWEA